MRNSTRRVTTIAVLLAIFSSACNGSPTFSDSAQQISPPETDPKYSILNGNGSQWVGRVPLDRYTYTDFYWHYKSGWVSDRYPNQKYLSIITYKKSESWWRGGRTKEFHWHTALVRNDWGRLCIYIYEVNTRYQEWIGCGNNSRPKAAWVSDLGYAYRKMLQVDGIYVSQQQAAMMAYLVIPVLIAAGVLIVAPGPP